MTARFLYVFCLHVLHTMDKTSTVKRSSKTCCDVFRKFVIEKSFVLRIVKSSI